MRAHEIIEGMNRGLNAYVASVRAVVAGAGSISSKVKIEADSLNSARYLLYRIYGRENVFSIQQALVEDGVTKPLTPAELQVKSLTDKSAQLKQQAKKTKSLQKLQKAQQNYAQVSSSVAKSSLH
jgi:uncharacterized protein YgiM (DUF1202 family)